MTEKQSRWGSKEINTGNSEVVHRMDDLRQDVISTHNTNVQQGYFQKQQQSKGYGGGFGVQSDRQDKVYMRKCEG